MVGLTWLPRKTLSVHPSLLHLLLGVEVESRQAEADQEKPTWIACACALTEACPVRFTCNFVETTAGKFIFNNCFIYILHYPWLDSYAWCILCSFHVWPSMCAFLSHHCSLASLTHISGRFSSYTYCTHTAVNYCFFPFSLCILQNWPKHFTSSNLPFHFLLACI